jgi:4-amino-4-deoxy-L-arabinose transferase-like glycosyltransferase
MDTSAPSEKPPATSFFDRLGERKTVAIVLLFGALLYIPLAGSYGLWDPWETHYGEVGREMLERGDYISLYWAGSPLDSENFWSKPVLTFWLIALSMGTFGLGGASKGTFATSSVTEWAMRLPFCLMALAALYGVYLVTSRFVSRRAGVLAAVVLGTMPMFSLIARQAMADMPFVGLMTLALALCIVALFDTDETELPRKTWKRWSWPHHTAFYVAMGLLALTFLPQFVIDALQLVWRFRISGKRMMLPGVFVMLPYLAGFVFLVFHAARVRSRAPLYLYTAGVLAALAVLAKGLAGLGLPVIVLVCYLVFTWNWPKVLRPQIIKGFVGAIIACAVVAVPWHHAMLVRHGKPFWNELYGDNHWRRLVTGRHGDRGTFEYFLREAGYAVLPWLTFVPAALLSIFRRTANRSTDSGQSHRRDVFWFGVIWFVSAYTVVSLSMTKFHHYILPALPGLAIAIACLIEDVLDDPKILNAKLVPLIGIPALGIVAFDMMRNDRAAQLFIWLFAYDYVNSPGGRPWPPELSWSTLIAGFVAAWALMALLWSWRSTRKVALLGTIGTAVAFTYFLLDVYMKKVSDIWTQKELTATYYKMRKSPAERLIAWQLYWRGETFYTQNEIYEGPMESRTVFLGNRNAEDLQAYLGRNTGKRMFFVVERGRFDQLRGLLPEAARPSLKIVHEKNNKFYLAQAQL